MVVEEVGKKPDCVTLHPDSAKFACGGRVCGWLPIKTKLKTNPSTARLDPKKVGCFVLVFRFSKALKV